MHYFTLIFLWFMYQNVNNRYELRNNTRRYEILHTLNLYWTCIILLSESHAIINDLDVILHTFIKDVYRQINTWAFPYWPGYYPETPILARDEVEAQYRSRDNN